MLLLGDPFPFRTIGSPQLVEAVDHSGNLVKTIAQTGVFQNSKVVNQNRRQYPERIWTPHFTPGSPFQQRVESRNAIGRIEHPSDGIMSLAEASHLITMARPATPGEIARNSDLEEGDIIGTLEPIKGTVGGNHLIALIEGRVLFGVSSRGDGTVTESGDVMIVNEDFNLDVWDAVLNPSVSRATLGGLKSPLQLDEVTESLKQGKNINALLEHMTLHESSFVLCTGIMNNGEKLIPVQLIAESGDLKRLSWITEGIKLEGLEPFTDANSAITGIKQFCESRGIELVLPFTNRGTKVATPITESSATKATNMTTRDELRHIQTEVVQLGQTSTKGLKPSMRAAFFERVNDYRVKLDTLVSKDASLKTLTEGVHTRLNEFEGELDKVDDPAPETAPIPSEPEGEHAEPDGDEFGGDELGAEDDAGESSEVQNALAQVEDTLSVLQQALSGNIEKDRIQAAIQNMEDLCADLGGGCGEEGGDEAAAGAPDEADFGADSEDLAGDVGGDYNDEEDVIGESKKRKIARKLKESRNKSRKAAKKTPYLLKLERQVNLGRKRYKALEEAADALYNSFRKLSESSPKGEGSNRTLSEAVKKANRFESAARELAEKYNRDMLELATAYLRSKSPALYEKYYKQICKADTFMKLHKLAEHIVSTDPSIVNSPTPAKKKVNESKEPLTESKAGSEPARKDEIHESLKLVKNARRK